jgi:hypothetical protein
MGRQPVASVLTDEQRSQSERDGYVVLDRVDVPVGTLDGIVKDLDGRYVSTARRENGVSYGTHRITNAWKGFANVKALDLAPNVLATLEALYGRKAVGWQTLNFRKSTEQNPHSDTLHFNSDPPGFHVRRLGSRSKTSTWTRGRSSITPVATGAHLGRQSLARRIER